jgi:hypothetical protein
MGKIEIRLSRLLVQMAMNDAAATAVCEELYRQTREQVRGTRLENSPISVHYGFADHTTTVVEWNPIPDSEDLTFTWVD